MRPVGGCGQALVVQVAAWWGEPEWAQKLQETPKTEAGVQGDEPEVALSGLHT